MSGLHVAVLGTGRMGSQIGCEYALGGHRVTFVARDAARGRAAADAALDLATTTGLHPAGAIEQARGRIAVETALGAVDDDAGVVVESVPEDLALKVALLGDAARRWPAAIIASNTSSIPIGRIGEGIGAPERTIGTHYWNPPLLMPLVEVIRTDATDDAVVDRILALLRDLGKRPVQVQRDVPGFVWNRLQLALLREALWVVEQGVATPEVVDEIVRDGLARRWRLTGPFETVEHGGPATFAAVAANLLSELSDATEAPGLATLPVRDADALAARAARRDAGLIAELHADRDAATDPDPEPA
ncbi:3-hydroxyacyl-CoA dehydrogenase family protein [Baekduia soli]|uniref:3-hydroxyacyl-CoA dehydrogenase family protein n=1 Tax=Baekduia soli TaxID=496014 RepID=A0A5B8UAN5_9ACTN|nr:3-hydroxyacyl-CoA dehydrogenase family protein [Baekduia soli]QEC49732.1 3-hydroxyacyl-CoA dehydrogenase family protein [Baekduia soli]